jgi:hypothetical protein
LLRLSACNEWKGVAKRIISKLGRELISGAGNAAFVGREVNKVYMNSAIAEMKFNATLKEYLG